MSDSPSPLGDNNPFEVAESVVNARRQAEYDRWVFDVRNQVVNRLTFYGLTGAVGNQAVFRSDNHLVDTLVTTESNADTQSLQIPYVRIFRSEEVETRLPHAFLYEEVAIYPDGDVQTFMDVLILDKELRVVKKEPVVQTFALTAEGELSIRNPVQEPPFYFIRSIDSTGQPAAVQPFGNFESFEDREHALSRAQALVTELHAMQMIYGAQQPPRAV